MKENDNQLAADIQRSSQQDNQAHPFAYRTNIATENVGEPLSCTVLDTKSKNDLDSNKRDLLGTTAITEQNRESSASSPSSSSSADNQEARAMGLLDRVDLALCKLSKATYYALLVSAVVHLLFSATNTHVSATVVVGLGAALVLWLTTSFPSLAFLYQQTPGWGKHGNARDTFVVHMFVVFCFTNFFIVMESSTYSANGCLLAAAVIIGVNLALSSFSVKMTYTLLTLGVMFRYFQRHNIRLVMALANVSPASSYQHCLNLSVSYTSGGPGGSLPESLVHLDLSSCVFAPMLLVGLALPYMMFVLTSRNFELLEKYREVAEASGKKSSLLAAIAHEVRTPLNSILGCSDLLLLKIDEMPNHCDGSKNSLAKIQAVSSEAASLVSQVMVAGSMLLDSLNSILDYTKLEGHKMKVDNSRFKLRKTIKDVLSVVSIKCLEKRLELKYEVDDLVPEEIVGDCIKIKQVLLNLLGNACKFTQKGSITLSVAVDTNAQRIIFQVRDTGIGMTPDTITILFQPFMQAEASTARKYGGSGLGLAIAKELVELMEGQIWVHSVENMGSSFYFSIPIIPTDAFESVSKTSESDATTQVGDLKPPTERVVKRRRRSLVVVDYPEDAHNKITIAVHSHPSSPSGPDVESQSCVDTFSNQTTSRRMGYEATGATNDDSNQTAPSKEETNTNTATLPNIVCSSTSNDYVEEEYPIFSTTTDSSVNLRVLVIDDNNMNVQIYSKMMRNLGILQVDTATSGHDALQAVRNSTSGYDCIFTDIQMPDISGLDVAKEIRRLSCNSFDSDTNSIRWPMIYALSGNEPVECECLDGFVQKPVRMQTLKQIIDVAIKHKLEKNI